MTDADRDLLFLAATAEQKEFLRKLESCAADACWLWTGAVNPQTGYGVVGKIRSGAHRRAYELFIGPIPPGRLICHRCDVRRCCNPTHLFLGTHKDNMQDMINKGRDDHTRPPRGTDNGMSKLTPEAVRSIRGMSGQMPHRKIAAHFGISRSACSRIINRTAWAHLP